MDDDADAGNVSCSFCSFSFCSSCDLLRHTPATCQQIVQWEEQEGYLETGSEEEILARQCKLKTTKPCPKCSVRIEKNGKTCPTVVLGPARAISVSNECLSLWMSWLHQAMIRYPLLISLQQRYLPVSTTLR